MPGMTPSHASRRRWLLLLIAAPAAVAVWSGWVGLGALAGFGVVHPLPGIADGFRLNTAITLPVGVEAYGAYALGVWLAPLDVPARARAFARRSAIGALLLGMVGQVSYHLLAAAHDHRAPSIVVVAVSCMPVVTLGFGAALTHLQRAGEPETAAEMAPAAAPQPAPVLAPADGPEVAPQAGPIVAPAMAPGSGPSVAPQPAPRMSQPSPRLRLMKDPEAERARAAYRKSARDGSPLSDRALAAKFPGRSRNWAAGRIREVGEGPSLAEAQ